MEICERAEAWKEQDDDYVFDHMKIIFKSRTENYFYAKINKRVDLDAIDTLDLDEVEFDPDKNICSQFGSILVNTLELGQLDLVPIPNEDIWPQFPEFLTTASDPMSKDCYIKRANLLDYETGDGPDNIHKRVLGEAQVCEILLKNPHPNLAKYRGCEVVNGRIRGLCFDRYTMTLQQRLKTGKPLDKQILQGIKDGISHLHGLGLIHNDINPRNIMVDADETLVIIDFDSCQREGEELITCGTPDWSLEDMQYASRENDFFGLSKVEEMLSGVSL